MAGRGILTRRTTGPLGQRTRANQSRTVVAQEAVDGSAIGNRQGQDLAPPGIRGDRVMMQPHTGLGPCEDVAVARVQNS